MTIKDMAVGASICLGSVVPPYNAARIDLTWMKVNRDNLFMLNEGNLIHAAMDAKEPDSPSRQRRTRGCSFFPNTALFQWLNSAGEGWYKPFGDTDFPPDYVTVSGFLSLFSDLEKSMLVQHRNPIVTPEGFKKDYGLKTGMDCLVSLPSYSQLYPMRADTSDVTYAFEGAKFEVRSSDNDRPKYAWTRTGQSGYIVCTREGSDLPDHFSPCDRLYVYPVIKLKEDAEIEGYNNLFMLRPPEGTSLSIVKESDLEGIWVENI